MAKILILGGAGFIGFNLAKSLQKDTNNKITIADNLSRGKMDDSLSLLVKQNNVDFIQGDFTDEKSFKKLDKDYD